MSTKHLPKLNDLITSESSEFQAQFGFISTVCALEWQPVRVSEFFSDYWLQAPGERFTPPGHPVNAPLQALATGGLALLSFQPLLCRHPSLHRLSIFIVLLQIMLLPGRPCRRGKKENGWAMLVKVMQDKDVRGRCEGDERINVKHASGGDWRVVLTLLIIY